MLKKGFKILLLVFVNSLPLLASAGDLPLPGQLSPKHPRSMAANVDRAQIQQLVLTVPWAKGIYDETLKAVDAYVQRHETDPQWIVSRLQMYWKTKHTDVFINGGKYSHAEGEAPVPTVRFNGARDNTTIYSTPSIEAITPYMDDERGLYLQNGKKEGKPWEWADQASSGCIVDAINRRMMQLAEKAAFIYWYTGDEAYAKFAYDLFDTYMTGMYYRKMPIDVSYGHHQTLTGLATFEVIHEDILNELTVCYDFLHPYIQKNASPKIQVYTDTFKKWADLIVSNGVTFNNWNLHKANFISRIAIILENDADYADGKGCQYYFDVVLNKGGDRQWAMTKLLNYGYDSNTGIWNESCGYASGMVTDFLKFVDLYDRQFHIDLIPYMPVLPKASMALCQYLYPNDYTVGFGDGYYKKLSAESMEILIRNAQHYGKADQEKLFTSLFKMIQGEGYVSKRTGNNFRALFDGEPLKLRGDISAAKYSDYQTNLFSAPNVSWVMQRNGGNPQTGLAISQIGSLGNHCHANGIAMELYGKGLALATEMGIGTSYFQIDYAEYYSQFPAHNTVVVDGKSSYPVMKSNHAFKVEGAYPQSQQKSGFIPGYSFSNLSFIEPETYADQNRVMGIIRISETTGYYIDIFRSRKREGGDIKHDYIYHNIGQQFMLEKADGSALDFNKTVKLGFADNDLMAYDYFWNKQEADANSNIKGQFSLSLPSGQNANMNLWVKGDENRQIFKGLGPVSKSYRDGAMGLGELAKLPVPVMVIRQNGQAWSHPFVAVYQPSDGTETDGVKTVNYFNSSSSDSTFVGVMVESVNGRKDFILSSMSCVLNQFDNIKFIGSYGVVTEDNETITLFLGMGNKLSAKGITLLSSIDKGGAALTVAGSKIHLTSGAPTTLTFPDVYPKGIVSLQTKSGIWIGKRTKNNTAKVVTFLLPAISWTDGEIVVR